MDRWNHTIQSRANEILLYAIVIEFQLFGSVWAMLNISGRPYLLLYWGFVGLGLVKLCIQRNTWEEWLFIIGFGAIAFFSWRGSEDKTPLLLMLGVCCSKEVKLDRLMKIDLIGRIVSAAVLIIFPLLSLCEMQMIHDRGIERIYFGWQAANGMGLSFLIIGMEWMYLRHRRFRWFDYAGILAMLVFLDRTANSRTSELLILGILVIELSLPLTAKYGHKIEEYKVWTLGCLAALLMTLLLPGLAVLLYVFKNQELMAMPGNFIVRFQLAGRFYETHGLSLFGSPYDPFVYDYLDMLFAYLLMHLGIVIAIIVLILMAATIIYGYRKKDEKLLLFFMFVLLRSTVESEHFTLVYAFFPILLGLAVWKKQTVSGLGNEKK